MNVLIGIVAIVAIVLMGLAFCIFAVSGRISNRELNRDFERRRLRLVASGKEDLFG